MKKAWSVIWKVGVIIVVIAIIIFANRTHKKSQIKDVSIAINYEGKDTLVTAQGLKKVLDKKIGNLVGKERDKVNTNEIEKLLEDNPYISKVNAFISLRGNLSITVEQRKPIVRIKTVANKEYYLDQNGYSFPTSSIGAAHVLVASGNIKASPKGKDSKLSVEKLRKDSIWNKSEIIKVYDLAKYIEADPLLKAQIDQIYLNSNNEFELIPKVGNHTILLGDINNLDEKFEKLLAFYKEGLSNVGWDLYGSINLKFKNQVVCTKKDNSNE